VVKRSYGIGNNFFFSENLNSLQACKTGLKRVGLWSTFFKNLQTRLKRVLPGQNSLKRVDLDHGYG